MKPQLTLLGIAAALWTVLAGGSARADFLPNNFWPNPTFEVGTNLDQMDGAPTGWSRTGSDPTICQVTTDASLSSTHALAVIDQNDAGYGEWDSDMFNLAGFANPGDAITVQWSELYDVSGGEMRLTIGFYDASGAGPVAENHFTVNGSSSGWQGTIAASTFTHRTQTVAVPAGAAKLRIALVSGGSEATTGTMVIDDLSVATPPQPRLLAGNIWPNPSFENGDALDTSSGTPTGWNRGGSDGTICQVTTNNFVSATHALLVQDASTSNYGEWYSDLSLGGRANPGDSLSIQWFELYSVTNGEMRVSVLFLDSKTNVIQQNHFTATGQSPGWRGQLVGSGFTQRRQALVVPPGGVTMRISLVSGGPSTTTGIMAIDDLSVAPPPQPLLLADNFWPNPSFETGSGLNLPTGTPDGWVRNGSDTNICQVTTNNFTSPIHALAVIDTNDAGYGEWDAELDLAGKASPGDLLDVQWSERYSVTNGEMRVTVLFLDRTNGVAGTPNDFTVNGQSGGWQGDIAGSTFTLRKQQVTVPSNAVRMRVALVSGGPETTLGVMLIDDLSVARHPIPATVLTGNFFPNPTFEDGAQLDNPTVALPAGGWQRGGSDSSIDQVTTNDFVSPTHALSLVDSSDSNYGEWYMFFNLTGLVTDGDTLDLHWFQAYSTTNGNMRLSFAFLDATSATLGNQDFSVTGQSAGWTGTIAGSPFEEQFQQLTVPAGTTLLRVNFASGGAASATGLVVIDDLSVRLSRVEITSIAMTNVNNVTLTWRSIDGKTYTVQSTDALSPTATWTALTTGLAATGPTTSYVDSPPAATPHRFYRIIQE